jgi:microsomal dipeptidase-like Zn-dependent dipeptidase
MNTGHVSNEEALRLLDLSEQYGIKNRLVASSVTKNMSIDEQKLAVSKGAFIEHTLAAFTHTTSIPKTHYYVEREYAAMDEGIAVGQKVAVRDVGEQIQAVGADHCIIATDFGVYTLPPPVEGFREFIACMLDVGLTEDEIRKLVSTNPAQLLGLDA